ncbi:MAG: hypothetical protein ABSF69_18940 [Polyangiaceae bacterium]|jgi:hypothetical protein
MNWRLVFSLSLFGLAMGIATVCVIRASIEPALWLVLLVVCAVRIAKFTAPQHFLQASA